MFSKLKIDKGENGHWGQTAFFDAVNTLQDSISVLVFYCCSNKLLQTYVAQNSTNLSYSSGGQKVTMGFTGLKSRC